MIKLFLNIAGQNNRAEIIEHALLYAIKENSISIVNFLMKQREEYWYSCSVFFCSFRRNFCVVSFKIWSISTGGRISEISVDKRHSITNIVSQPNVTNNVATCKGPKFEHVATCTSQPVRVETYKKKLLHNICIYKYLTFGRTYPLKFTLISRFYSSGVSGLAFSFSFSCF